MPDVASVTDEAFTLWTLGAPVPGQAYAEILQNGVQVGEAAGVAIWFVNHRVYVQGDDAQWWRWTGTAYEFASAARPES